MANHRKKSFEYSFFELGWLVDHTFTIKEINTFVGPMFSQNIQTNPWFQKYKQFLNNHKKLVACASSH
jgi:hypothetical protein